MKKHFGQTDKSKGEDKLVTKALDADMMQLYKKGLGLKKEVQGILRKDYYSGLIEYLRANNYELQAGDLTLYLAREFGFCYGVDRAVDYAYQTREKFPDRRIFLTGEIIHNPHVNTRLIDMGVHFLSGQYSTGTTIPDLQPDDVVILPAFGVSIQEFEALKASQCVLVDTTCGSVLNVWKRVEHYARNNFTSIIHGKYYHEETIATSSQALKYDGGNYLVVRNMDEALKVCDYILHGGDKAKFTAFFEKAVSPGFDPDRDLRRVGLANQTTMLSSESLAIADELRKAMFQRFGEQELEQHFMTFDTICSATQDRQDAVLALVEKQKLDLMLVIGGFNSSNTNHLAEITSNYTTTYHIDDSSCILSPRMIRHKKVGSHDIIVDENWLRAGKLRVGLTAGASTPNNKVGEVVEKVLSFRGIDSETLMAA